MMSQRIFNKNSIAKEINSLSSPDPISGICILQEWNHCWATVYVTYVQGLQSNRSLAYRYYWLICLISVYNLLFRNSQFWRWSRMQVISMLPAGPRPGRWWSPWQLAAVNCLCTIWSRRARLPFLSWTLALANVPSSLSASILDSKCWALCCKATYVAAIIVKSTIDSWRSYVIGADGVCVFVYQSAELLLK